MAGQGSFFAPRWGCFARAYCRSALFEDPPHSGSIDLRGSLLRCTCMHPAQLSAELQEPRRAVQTPRARRLCSRGPPCRRGTIGWGRAPAIERPRKRGTWALATSRPHHRGIARGRHTHTHLSPRQARRRAREKQQQLAVRRRPARPGRVDGRLVARRASASSWRLPQRATPMRRARATLGRARPRGPPCIGRRCPVTGFLRLHGSACGRRPRDSPPPDLTARDRNGKKIKK